MDFFVDRKGETKYTECTGTMNMNGLLFGNSLLLGLVISLGLLLRPYQPVA